jgi:hypothetical protein
MKDFGIKASMERKSQATRKASSTKGDNKGRAPQLRAYCPTCPPVQTDPELSPHVTVSPKTKKATCPKCQEVFPVGRGSY